jgi:tRNA-splicing ligase RtcB (3'-phosphate/5'-hydroxy nucleic acid ligase)
MLDECKKKYNWKESDGSMIRRFRFQNGKAEMNNFKVMTTEKGVLIKAWTKGVQLEDAARQQLLKVAPLPFIYRWVAAMPDVHWGIGATVGSVIPTRGAIIPASPK